MISIIIPYYGVDLRRQEALGLLLRTLSMQNFKEEKEVILVYQGSEKKFSRIQPLLLSIVDEFIFLGRGSKSFNKAWCINVAVRRAKYDTFVIIDADMIFGLDYLKLLYQYSQRYLFCVLS